MGDVIELGWVETVMGEAVMLRMLSAPEPREVMREIESP